LWALALFELIRFHKYDAECGYLTTSEGDSRQQVVSMDTDSTLANAILIPRPWDPGPSQDEALVVDIANKSSQKGTPLQRLAVGVQV